MFFFAVCLSLHYRAVIPKAIQKIALEAVQLVANLLTGALFFFVFCIYSKNLEKDAKGYIPLRLENSQAINDDFPINNRLRIGSEVVAHKTKQTKFI